MLDTGRGCLRETVGEARQAGVQGMEGAGVLHLAAINGSMNVVRYLVETMRFDVDDLDKEGRTPLVSAVHSGRIGTVKYLLDHGANKDKASEGGLTPLHSAAGLGDCKMVKLLLAKGAYVDPLSDCGTPLHLAATEGQDGTMKILLDHKADAGADINGDYVLTALTDTSFNSVMVVVALVISHTVILSMHHAASLHLFSILDDTLIQGAPVSRSITELKSLGSMAFQSKNYLHAAGFYSKAMDLDPDDATLFSNRSLCWLRRGHGGKALLDAHECRKKQPDWSKACYRLGASLMSLKDYGSACDALFDGLKLDPADVQIENALREAFQNLKLSRSTKAK
nr:ankyrin-1 [Oryza sativa Japonica Group]